MRHLCRRETVLLAVSFAVLAGSFALGDEVTVEAIKDTTLYESPSGTIGNGSGQHFFTGRTNQGFIRRGLVKFDVAGSVPDGAKVTGVRLELTMSKTISGEEIVALHRLLSDWGEGSSDAQNEEGGGTGAESGDATWVHIYFDTEFWPEYSFGGLFDQSPSAMEPIGREGVYTWGSTSQMVADVQAWVDDPSSNHGWILVGNEAAAGTAKRFDSKDNPDSSVHPVLRVEFAGDGEAVPPTCSAMPSLPAECEGETTTVMLNGTGEAGKSAVIYGWDGPCSISDPTSPMTTAQCAGTGAFPFTLTVTTDGNDDGIADADEPSVVCDVQAMVMDTRAPSLIAPRDAVVQCTGAGGARVDLVARASDACSTAAVSNSRTGKGADAGGAFRLGDHTVVWTATDDAGNDACDWTNVAVIDTTPPDLSCGVSAGPVFQPLAVRSTYHHGGWNDEDEDEDEDGDDDGGGDDGGGDDGGGDDGGGDDGGGDDGGGDDGGGDDGGGDDGGGDDGGGCDDQDVPGPVDRLRIHVASSDTCCDPTAHAVIDLDCMQLSVTDGQMIGVACVDPTIAPTCEAFVDDQGLLRIYAANAVLRAESTDCAGNAGSCAIDLCDGGVPSEGVVPDVQGTGAGTGASRVTGEPGKSTGSRGESSEGGGGERRRTVRRRP